MTARISWRAGLAVGGALLLAGFHGPPAQFVEATRLAGHATSPPQTPDRVMASRDVTERMTVPVRINGQGPYPFVIDTGADRTVVSRELADQLGLDPGEPVLLNGTGGVDLTPTARIEALDVGARRMRDLAAPTLAASNLGAAGLLGVDSLRDQRMLMDFHRGAMSVQPSKRRLFGADVIVVRAKSRYGQLVLVDASINGRSLAVIVDSGAQSTIGNLALEREVLGAAAAPQTLLTEVVSVSGRTTPARFANVPQVRIGGVTINNVPIAFADLHTFAEFDMNGGPAMLLGMDVLRHFDRVAIDFGRKEVSFQPPL